MENVLACFTEIALYQTFGKPVFSCIYELVEKENTECACLSCFIQIRIQFRLLKMKADTLMHFEEKRVFIFRIIFFSVDPVCHCIPHPLYLLKHTDYSM